MKSYADIIKRPLITEKTAALSIGQKYVFEVEYTANKTLVKQAIQHLFPGTKVDKVNIMNVKPKAKRVGRYLGKTKRVRKAIVTLTRDSKAIEIF
ncbi:50S ribosomal protein L23 [Erysipelotrichaceae bacterium]|nr:50S ribosomal protein L23 [Erysipelotrichaceae bacterium]